MEAWRSCDSLKGLIARNRRTWSSLELGAPHLRKRASPLLRPALQGDRIRFHPRALAGLQVPCTRELYSAQHSRQTYPDATDGAAAAQREEAGCPPRCSRPVPGPRCSLFIQRCHVGTTETQRARDLSLGSARPQRGDEGGVQTPAQLEEPSTRTRGLAAPIPEPRQLPRPSPRPLAAWCVQASCQEDASLGPTRPSLDRVPCSPHQTPTVTPAPLYTAHLPRADGLRPDLQNPMAPVNDPKVCVLL